MSTTIRAKFRCVSETQTRWSTDQADLPRTYRFQAMYDPDLAEEDRSFAKATPSGTLEIQVDNPAAQFEIGAYYYLDFTKVTEGG